MDQVRKETPDIRCCLRACRSRSGNGQRSGGALTQTLHLHQERLGLESRLGSTCGVTLAACRLLPVAWDLARQHEWCNGEDSEQKGKGKGFDARGSHSSTGLRP